MRQIVGRLAPSPTGPLHIGNIWAFFLCYLAVRKASGKLILRVDDIDRDRCKADFIPAMINDLEWLGFDWDEVAFQSDRLETYENAIEKLRQANLVYPCFCSRRELRQMASAPHGQTVPYPGTCRNLAAGEINSLMAGGKRHSLRLKAPKGPVAFEDLVLGRLEFPDYGEDFALKRADNVFSYQFTSALDDLLLGVSLVVRGRDLAPSTPGQEGLKLLLGGSQASYAHVPLMLDAGGERLAKRHKSVSIKSMRESGARPEEIIGKLGHLAGLAPSGSPKRLADFIEPFSWHKVPKKDPVWDPAS